MKVITYDFIAEANPQDLLQIIDLYREAGWLGNAPDERVAIAKLIQGSHCFVTARYSGQIVGMGRALSDRVSDAYIQDVTVRREWRKRGIARKIVKALVERLNNDGIGWIGLIAERGTHALYADLGFSAMPDSTPLLYQSVRTCS